MNTKMQKYLTDLPGRSDEHKRRFALFVSSGLTLFIFAIWSLVRFGIPASEQAIVAENYEAEEARDESEMFERLGTGVSAAYLSLKERFIDGFSSININEEYEEMRREGLDNYGR